MHWALSCIIGVQAVLRLEELREDNSAQQKALQEARRQFEILETR